MKRIAIVLSLSSLLLSSASSETLQLQLTGMTPHVGQMFESRLVDLSTGIEAGRTTVSAIPNAEFFVKIFCWELDRDYNIDFYADFNENSMYDPPPTDHAWRLLLEDVQGDSRVKAVFTTLHRVHVVLYVRVKDSSELIEVISKINAVEGSELFNKNTVCY